MKVLGIRPKRSVIDVDIEFATSLSFSFTVSKIAEERRGKRPPNMKARRPKTTISVTVSSMKGIGSARTEAKKTKRLMLASIYLPKCYSLCPVFLGVANLERMVPSKGATSNVEK